MRYITVVCLIAALALPVVSQTELETLKTQRSALTVQINNILSAESLGEVSIDSTLAALGYAVQIDTINAEFESDYVQVVIPDSLIKETVWAMRTYDDFRGVRYLQTPDRSLIRMHKGHVPRLNKALLEVFAE